MSLINMATVPTDSPAGMIITGETLRTDTAPWGFACRFSSSHVTAEHVNMVKEGVHDPDFRGATCNILSRALQEDLRKRRVGFERSELYLEKLKGTGMTPDGTKLLQAEDGGEAGVCSGAVVDDVRLRPREKKMVRECVCSHGEKSSYQ